MAYTMKKGGAVKIVDTDIQKRELLDNGFKVVSGSVTSGKTNVLGSKPYMRESVSNSGNINFRGTGYDGEPLDSLGYIAKKAEPGIADANFPPLYELQRVPEDADVFTSVEFVAELPDPAVANVIYILSAADGTKAQGTAWYFNTEWLAYTAGDVLDVNHGADNKMALLSTYVSSNKFAALPIATENTEAAIEPILLAELQTAVNAGKTKTYTVEFVGATRYTTATGVWAGKIKVTNDTDATDTVTDAANRTFLFGSFVAMKLVTDLAISTVPNGTVNTIEPITAAIVAKANTAIAAMTGYVVSVVAGYAYTSPNWAGKLKVTQTSAGVTNTFTDAINRALEVTIAAP